MKINSHGLGMAPTVIEVPVGAMPSPWEFIFMDKVRGT